MTWCPSGIIFVQLYRGSEIEHKNRQKSEYINQQTNNSIYCWIKSQINQWPEFRLWKQESPICYSVILIDHRWNRPRLTCTIYMNIYNTCLDERWLSSEIRPKQRQNRAHDYVVFNKFTSSIINEREKKIITSIVFTSEPENELSLFRFIKTTKLQGKCALFCHMRNWNNQNLQVK